jgi:transcriptional regulator with XRE-family HTH domain
MAKRVPLTEEFCDQIRKRLTHLGLYQADLAVAMNIDQAQLRRILNQKQDSIYDITRKRLEAAIATLESPMGFASFGVLAWDASQNRFAPIQGSLRNGDRVQIRLNLNQPAYVFIAWVDQNGTPWPMYPGLFSNSNEMHDWRPVKTITVPEVADGNCPGNVQIEGPAGLETIVAMLSQERPSPIVTASLRSVLTMPATLNLACEVTVPVISRFRNSSVSRQASASSRYPVFAKEPSAVRAFQQGIWQRLQRHFQEVWVCTFANAGPRRS